MKNKKIFLAATILTIILNQNSITYAMDVDFLRIGENEEHNTITINSLKNKKELNKNEQYNSMIIKMKLSVEELIKKKEVKNPYKGFSFSDSTFDQELLNLVIDLYYKYKNNKFNNFHFYKCHFNNKNMGFPLKTTFTMCTRGKDKQQIMGLKD